MKTPQCSGPTLFEFVDPLTEDASDRLPSLIRSGSDASDQIREIARDVMKSSESYPLDEHAFRGGYHFRMVRLGQELPDGSKRSDLDELWNQIEAVSPNIGSTVSLVFINCRIDRLSLPFRPLRLAFVGCDLRGAVALDSRVGLISELHLRQSTVAGSLRLSGSYRGPVYLNRCHFGAVSLTELVADAPLSIEQCNTSEKVSVAWSRFVALNVRGCYFRGHVSLNASEVGLLKLDNAHFLAGISLWRHCEIQSQSRITSCTFGKSSMDYASLGGTIIRDVDLRLCSLRGADLRQADLRGCTGFEFDGQDVLGIRLDSGSNDKWSVLKRAYSGPWLLINAMLLLMFVAVRMIEAGGWIAVARVEGLVVDRVGTGAVDGWRAVPVWKLLSGMERGSLWAVAVFVAALVYNAMRCVLTVKVANMRDEEARSGMAPLRTGLVVMPAFVFMNSHKSVGYWKKNVVMLIRMAVKAARWWEGYEWCYFVHKFVMRTLACVVVLVLLVDIVAGMLRVVWFPPL
jgi:hypothetical protein